MSKKNLSDAEDTSYSFSPKSTKPSHELRVYKTIAPHAYVLDFRDNERLPTKHVALSEPEMELLRDVIIGQMNYTEILRALEKAENK